MASGEPMDAALMAAMSMPVESAPTIAMIEWSGSAMAHPETTVGLPPPESMTVLKTRLVGSRSHRVCIEWVLNGHPSLTWIAAFNTAISAHQDDHAVESAYGRPLLMDGTVVWSVIDTEMRSALSAVKFAVSYANVVQRDEVPAHDPIGTQHPPVLAVAADSFESRSLGEYRVCRKVFRFSDNQTADIVRNSILASGAPPDLQAGSVSDR